MIKVKNVIQIKLKNYKICQNADLNSLTVYNECMGLYQSIINNYC